LDLIDGESLTGFLADSICSKSPRAQYRYSQSPAGGGFGGTPLFLNARPSRLAKHERESRVSPSLMKQLLPANQDLLHLILSFPSHRANPYGAFRSWLGHADWSSPQGRIRLLTGLGYVLLDGNATRSLTWSDVQYLQDVKGELNRFGDNLRELDFLISVILEDLIQQDLSLKFRLENVLDFNDQITIRGWTDGGRNSAGTHSEELRSWFEKACKDSGVLIYPPGDKNRQDDSPSNHPDSVWENIQAAGGPRFSPSGSRLDAEPLDPFTHSLAEDVFFHLGMKEENFESTFADNVRLKTPSHRIHQTDDDYIREIIVVDVQTDHALRRHINKATELKKQYNNERLFIQELKKFIQRRLHFETTETTGTVFRQAVSRGGFVHIGDVRSGAQSRHCAILFKTLCDATGVYCRLVRDPDDMYYNVVMISENSSLEDAGAENMRESNVSSNRASERTGESGNEDEDIEDVPEELIPVFWHSNMDSEKKTRLTHPLDCLLQRCNKASEVVDLDDFFEFDKLLGKGSFGEVWKVQLKLKQPSRRSPTIIGHESVLIPGKHNTGPFALKLIPPEDADKEEASFMRIYSHSRVINVIAVFRGYQALENRKREVERKPAMCILMELADKCLETVLGGSSVKQDVGSSKTGTVAPLANRLDLRFVFRILIDSARAMAFLHSPVGDRPHLVHRDLKPGNVLITSDGRAIVTDFGVARMNPSLETNLTVGAGTEGYMAPEQKTLLYDRPADVYSFGVIVARILGNPRWKDAINLTADDFDEDKADPVLVQLCLKCVQSSPLHRPSFEQIYQLLLCEFVRREFARTIVDASKEGKVQSRGSELKPYQRKLQSIVAETPGSSESADEHKPRPVRRNPPRKPTKPTQRVPTPRKNRRKKI
jgi:serine/threonine protein kinase